MPSRTFSIWIVTPAGYPHSRCLEEVALGLQAAFSVLGFTAPIVTEPALVRGRAVVLGANLLPHAAVAPPPGSIVYNLEQVQQDSTWLRTGYVELLRHHPVWDYSERNIAALASLYGISGVTLCGIGYMPVLSRIPEAEEDIDVLFVGSINERRKAVLDEIQNRGAKIAVVFNRYGEDRDALIARAKIVLNLHYFDAQVFEIVRVSYLLANRKCVVSEVGRDETLEAPLRGGVAFAPYAGLAETCVQLLADDAQRRRIAEDGFNRFRARSQVPMLKQALAALPDA